MISRRRFIRQLGCRNDPCGIWEQISFMRSGEAFGANNHDREKLPARLRLRGYMRVGRIIDRPEQRCRANSVVTESVPRYRVVVGNPARIIREFDRRKKWARVSR